MTNILQNEIMVDFVYPFLLIFFIVFAVLEKTKLFGDDKKQLNALIGFVIGLIFVGAVSPKLFVGELILFLTVAIVVVFVVMVLWGFATGSDKQFEGNALKIIIGIVVVIAVIVALFLITGVWDTVIDTLFKSNWSEDVWVNIVFIVVIALALAAVLLGAGKGAGK